MKKYLSIIVVCIFCACAKNFPDGECQYMDFIPDDIPFTIADSVWNVDSFGSQRAIVTIDATIHSENINAVQVTLPWRRPDLRPETKKVVVMDSQTGQEIKNVSIIDFSSEKGVIAFQPQTVPGTYELYYFPAKFRNKSGDARYGEPWNDYLSPNYDTDPSWEKEVKSSRDAIPEAKLVRFEARSRFDFFTSMGLVATEEEIKELKLKYEEDFILFPEDRAYPIRLTTIPARWVKKGTSNKFKGYALPNEY